MEEVMFSMQGIRCCLAEVVPIGENGCWPKNIANSMFDMVYGRIFTCYTLQELPHTYVINLSSPDEEMGKRHIYSKELF